MVPWTILATDGAYEPMRHLHLDQWDQIAQSDADHLASILATCQQWEEVDDPNGRELPRAKRHDDKSLAVIAFTQNDRTRDPE